MRQLLRRRRLRCRLNKICSSSTASPRSGKPKSIWVDNVPEFAGKLLNKWAYLNGVELDFSRPGTPTDNAFIEAFNARVPAVWLNANWFLSLPDACDRLEAWRIDYNTERSHSAFGHLTAGAFARKVAKARKVVSPADQRPGQDQSTAEFYHG